MLSDEEKRALERIDYIQDFIIENGQYNADVNDMEYFSKVLNLIEKQSKEIEEYKKQLDLDNECEIALNSKIMDLEKEIEELKEIIKENTILVKDENGDYQELNIDIKDIKIIDKIKAEIEELDNQKRQWIEDRNNKHKDSELIYAIEVLQSLLDKE